MNRHRNKNTYQFIYLNRKNEMKLKISFVDR